MAHVGRHAIVVGAGMAGLLAARALADHFDEVTVLERNALPDSPDPRKGVLQGRHTHGLLARGREVPEQLFPGFIDGIIAQGAVPADIVNDGLGVVEPLVAVFVWLDAVDLGDDGVGG